MRIFVVATTTLACTGCTGPAWPEDQFPAEVAVERTLFAAESGEFRETCQAIVVELTDTAASRLTHVKKTPSGTTLVPPSGWNSTPIKADVEKRAYYEGAFGGCGKGRPLGDLSGALTRPDAFYKIINGGEGIAVIVPHAKLAGFFYFG